MMIIFLVSLLVLAGGAALSLLPLRHRFLAVLIGPGPAVVAGGLAVFVGLGVLLGATPWHAAIGEVQAFVPLVLAMDRVSAFFVLAIGLSAVLAAIYGHGYLRGHLEDRHPGLPWAAFHLLVASMLLVVTAANGLLFLLTWEIMTLASFLLVVFDHQQAEVRRAGWIYLVATHLGTACLIPFFLLLAPNAAPFIGGTVTLSPIRADLCFLLALVGFGTKAGILPLHVWLPEAHPAAPSHVSALMSGVMIKTGIYGLVRTLMVLGQAGMPPMWWGWLLVGLGASSAIIGVLYALAQHDLKRLLAFSSVENIGIIVLGLGLGVVGMAGGHPILGILGLAGALLHVFNHSLFKGLLFLGAGAVVTATGSRSLDGLGGLAKRMPVTAPCFLVGSLAICGLPPLNGFISEFLVYAGTFIALADRSPTGVAVPALVVIVSLTLIGGLAIACFTKVFGIVFLGEPRSDPARQAHECVRAMTMPMVILAGACLLIGLAAPLVFRLVLPVAMAVFPAIGPDDRTAIVTALQPLIRTMTIISLCGGSLLVALLVLAWGRRRLLARRQVRQSVTWDCGYIAPAPRMQYTASSFAEPLLEIFAGLLRPHRHLHAPQGLFPTQASLHTGTDDACREFLFTPVFRVIRRLFTRLQALQAGRVQLYLLYVLVILLLLLLWNLG